MNDQPHNSISERVLEAIRAGKVRRRPRLYFILRLLATGVVGFLLFAFTALVVSFIIFSIHESGEQFLLGFGWKGIQVFFSLFPWVMTIIAVLLAILLEWLLRGFKFAYRVPLLYIFGGIVAVSILLGFLINVTPLHTKLLQHAERDELPVIGAPYQHILNHHEDQGIFRGIVTTASTSTFQMIHDDQDKDHDDEPYTVKCPEDISVPGVGSRVLVFGQREDGTPVVDAEYLQVLPQLDL